MKKFFGILAVFFLTLISMPALAGNSGKWIARFRLISVSPDDSSDAIANTGSKVDVDSDVVPEVDLTYMLNEHWGIEIIAATSKHDLSAKGGSLNGANIGSVKVLPPTVTVNYHFTLKDRYHPYVGVGFNYTSFYNYDLSGDLANLGVTHISFDSSTGIAGQLGIDIDLKDNWLINFDIKYIDISTDATIITANGDVLDRVSVDINPWVIGFGVGYRF